MDTTTVNVFGQLLAASAELEAMKAENYVRAVNKEAQAYDAKMFYEKAHEISNITHQLFR